MNDDDRSRADQTVTAAPTDPAPTGRPPHGYPPIPLSKSAAPSLDRLASGLVAGSSTFPRQIVIGWAGVGCGMVNAMLADGQLPNLRSLLVGREVSPLAPDPCLTIESRWATLATGVRPHEHGVLGPLVARDEDAGVRTVAMRDWRTRPFWKFAADAGRRVAVINWPATEGDDDGPASVHVGPRFFDAPFPDPRQWLMPHGCVLPAGRRSELRQLRMHASELSADEAAAVVTDPHLIDQVADSRLVTVMIALAAAVTTERVIGRLMDVDLVVACFTAVDEVYSALAGTKPPYTITVTSIVALYDKWLGKILAAATKSAITVIADGSPRDAGFHAGNTTASYDSREIRPTEFASSVLSYGGIPADHSPASAARSDVPAVDHLFDAGLGEAIDLELIATARSRRAQDARQLLRSRDAMA